jgi:hypothetical protein
MHKKPASAGEPLIFLQKALASDTNDCILWPYATAGAGYPKINLAERQTGAHRAVCEMTHGPCVDGKNHAAHSCGVRLCVNPKHIRWMTAKENAAEKKGHGTNNDGEKHGLSVLTDKQAEQIRQMFESGTRQAEISRSFGVGKMIVSRIVRGESYKALGAS